MTKLMYLIAKVPSKLCACARAHKSWGERTQENLEHIKCYSQKCFCTYFRHVIPNSDEFR